MQIIREDKGKIYSLNTKELSFEDMGALTNSVAKDILKVLQKEPMYPKQIAKELGLHEQNIYYYIKKLEKAKVIEIDRSENINGTMANYYKVTSQSFFFKTGEFSENSKMVEKNVDFLEPFIKDGDLNALIIVGSPEPHGPQKARSRDGYYGMDLALFLGSFLRFVKTSKVRLDTEVTDKELERNNLIIIGGPIVNKVTAIVNKHMPIYFDEDKKGIYSMITKKIYYSDEIGLINKFKSPLNPEKQILLLAGLRNAGTRATILAFLKHFKEIREGNSFNKEIDSKIVEGLDLDSDGAVDDVEFME